MKKYTAFYPFILLIIISSAMYLSFSDFAMIQKDKLRFIAHDKHYIMNHTQIGDSLEIELDWNNIRPSIGKKIYDDGECTIVIDDFQDDLNGGYKVFFRAQGSFNYQGGHLVTTLSRDSAIPDGFLQAKIGNDITINNAKFYMRGQQSDSQGDTFAYSIFPLTCYEYGSLIVDEQIKHNQNKVYIQLIGLQKFEWTRAS